VILDNIGGRVGEAAFAAIAPGGRFSAHGTPSGRFATIDPAEAHRRGVTVHGIEHVQLTHADRKRKTEQALAEAAAGHITPVIGQTFPLARAADAHAAIERREVFGKTLLMT
jgi:NADPH2:quinone reductase